MLIHYLKITIRGLLKDKTFALINILGLAVALTCCFLLLFWIKFEVSYENCFANRDRIYKLIEVEKRNEGIHHKAWIKDITKELKNTFP